MARGKNHRQKIVLVEMDDMAFTHNAYTQIKTEGVTTCIAFIVRGACWINDNLLSFCGLYHWSGFPLNNPDPLKAIIDIFTYFFETLRNELDVDLDSLITINELAFVGGEKCQKDEVSGEVLLSGTEIEVNCLYHAVKNYPFKEQLIDLDTSNVSHHHFLTSDEQSLSVTLDLNKWVYTFDEPLLNDEDNSEHTPRDRSCS